MVTVALWVALAGGHVAASRVAPRVAAMPSCSVRRAAPARARGHVAMALMKRGRGPPPPEHMINEFIKANELRVMAEAEEADQPDVPLGILSRADALARAQEMGVDLVCTSPGADPPVCKLIDYGRFRFQLEKKKKMMKKAAHTSEMKELKLSYTIETHDFNVRIRAAQKFLASGDKVRARARARRTSSRRALPPQDATRARARARASPAFAGLHGSDAHRRVRAWATRLLTRRAPSSRYRRPRYARTGPAPPQVKAVVQFKGREMQHTDIGTQLLKRMAESLSEFGSTDGPPKMSGNRMEVYITPKSRK